MTYNLVLLFSAAYSLPSGPAVRAINICSVSMMRVSRPVSRSTMYRSDSLSVGPATANAVEVV